MCISAKHLACACTALYRAGMSGQRCVQDEMHTPKCPTASSELVVRLRLQKAKRSLKWAGFSLPPPRSSGRHCTYLVLKSSAASLALSICKTMLAFSTVAARIWEGKKEKKGVKRSFRNLHIAVGVPVQDCSSTEPPALGLDFHRDCRERRDAAAQSLLGTNLVL